MSEWNQSPLYNKPDYVVCTCMGGMYSEILAAIDAGHASFDKLSEYLLVGTGCNSCIGEIEQILHDFSKMKKFLKKESRILLNICFTKELRREIQEKLQKK